MGYRRSHKTVTVTYEGELEGLHVRFKRASPDVMRHIVNTARAAQAATMFDQADTILNLCDAVGALLHEWNYEDEQGTPLPATAEVLAGEDVSFVLAVAYGWMDAMATRAQQLAPTQPDLAAEASLPMQVSG